MQDFQLVIGEWRCGSWDITLASKTLLVSDTRLQVPLHIVQIGEAEEVDSTLGRLTSRLGNLRSGSAEAPSSSWARVCSPWNAGHSSDVCDSAAGWMEPIGLATALGG